MFRGWRVRGGVVAAAEDEFRPIVAGIVNATPDSFFDGGRHATEDAAVAHGLRLAGEGADLLDVGGESTRPGAEPVPEAEEIRRTEGVVARLAAAGLRVCIDTRCVEVARRALEAGACAVNDLDRLRDPRMLELCVLHRAGACAVHMRGEPRTMQADPGYGDVVEDVAAFLGEAAGIWAAAGLPPDGLALDPGVGFGKTFGHNLSLVAATARFRDRFPGHPWYVGLSRKSWIRSLPGADPGSDRLAGSLGGALAASSLGCDVLRVHDVLATLEALRAFRACTEGSP